MRIVFMGTPDFAVPSLEALAAHHSVELCITRPDAVRARGKQMVASPVKNAALHLGIPVLEASKVHAEAIEQIRELAPDYLCVVAYGALLPDAVLTLPNYETLNVHGSLLPRWRGAAPIERAILAGDNQVGISIMQVVHELDAGPWLLKAAIEVADKNAAELRRELAELGAQKLLEAIELRTKGIHTWHDQDSEQVTYAAKISKAEMALNPNQSALANLRRVRASQNSAPARLYLGDRGMRVIAANIADPNTVMLKPGCFELVRESKHEFHLYIGCAAGALEITELKPDGKKTLTLNAFAQGFKDVFGTWSACG